jgi:hypothetical protein
LQHDFEVGFERGSENAWESRQEGRVLKLMGHNYGRDNVKKRLARRKKAERLVLAKKNKKKAAK